jgi:hypothetical protein
MQKAEKSIQCSKDLKQLIFGAVTTEESRLFHASINQFLN